MTNIKTVNLTGSEIKIDGLPGQNTIIRNLGSSTVYAGLTSGIVPDADGVAELPSGGVINLYGTHGTVFLTGSGKVQLTGTDYLDLNFVGSADEASSPTVPTDPDDPGITKEDIDKLFDGISSGSTDDLVISKEEIDSLFE